MLADCVVVCIPICRPRDVTPTVAQRGADHVQVAAHAPTCTDAAFSFWPLANKVEVDRRWEATYPQAEPYIHILRRSLYTRHATRRMRGPGTRPRSGVGRPSGSGMWTLPRARRGWRTCERWSGRRPSWWRWCTSATSLARCALRWLSRSRGNLQDTLGEEVNRHVRTIGQMDVKVRDDLASPSLDKRRVSDWPAFGARSDILTSCTQTLSQLRG